MDCNLQMFGFILWHYKNSVSTHSSSIWSYEGLFFIHNQYLLSEQLSFSSISDREQVSWTVEIFHSLVGLFRETFFSLGQTFQRRMLLVFLESESHKNRREIQICFRVFIFLFVKYVKNVIWVTRRGFCIILDATCDKSHSPFFLLNFFNLFLSSTFVSVIKWMMTCRMSQWRNRLVRS